MDVLLRSLDNIIKRCKEYAAESRCFIFYVSCVTIPSSFFTAIISHNSKRRSVLFYIMYCGSASLYMFCFDTIMYAKEVGLMGVF
jgi:hypothetical protein